MEMEELSLKIVAVVAAFTIAFLPPHGLGAIVSRSVPQENETQAAYPPESAVLDDGWMPDIDVWDNEFPITLDLAGSALLSKGNVIIKREQLQEIIFGIDSIHLFQGRYYYSAKAHGTGDTGKVTYIADYYVDAYTGEVYELLSLKQADELVPVGQRNT